jgi:hypothetical protein
MLLRRRKNVEEKRFEASADQRWVGELPTGVERTGDGEELPTGAEEEICVSGGRGDGVYWR